jgi:hypothetical protein
MGGEVGRRRRSLAELTLFESTGLMMSFICEHLLFQPSFKQKRTHFPSDGSFSA